MWGVDGWFDGWILGSKPLYGSGDFLSIFLFFFSFYRLFVCVFTFFYLSF